MSAHLNRWLMTRDGGAVARFHTLRVRPQTVAEHSVGVAEIILLVRRGGGVSRDLLIAALRHDVYEHVTGDTPATAKWEWDRLREELHAYEAKLNELHELIPDLPEPDQLLLKWADMFELVCFAWEEINHGNSHARVLFRNGMKVIRQLKLHPDDAYQVKTHLWGFIESINEEVGE